MSSEKKPNIELSPLKSTGKSSKSYDKLNQSLTDEDDVIIGRFRKISSAKSMAATNGNIQYPSDSASRSEDVDVKGSSPAERDKLLETPDSKSVNLTASAAATKSSFRNVEKPSRFRDQPSATRFKDIKLDDSQDGGTEGTEGTEESENDAMESDDPLTHDTKYAKSFRHFTREALPRLDNYRNIHSVHAAHRPSLDELHNASLSRKPGQLLEKDLEQSQHSTGFKFGWLKGVLMRCLLNIWGVMLFLRLSWVVGQAGVGQAILLIMMTCVVTTITALSMSAISTNGVIKGGGTYYMISRSLGPEFGGSIGLIFSMANAVACAMYVVGFGESLITLIPPDYYIVSKLWDQAIYGCIALVLLTGIVIIGMEWEAKAQIFLLIILLAAIGDFLIGAILGPKSDVEKSQGFLGYNMSLIYQNWGPDYREFEKVDYNFFSVFSIFFPAATGILAGANISGNLKDPQKSIPKGTLLAIALTTFSYIVIAIISGWTVMRDASGVLTSINATGDCVPCLLTSVMEHAYCVQCPLGVSNETGKCVACVLTSVNGTGFCEKCLYGLQNSNDVIRLVSAFGPLIYGGCFAATLSSALASLVSAPKVFQALCQDKLYPYLEFFAKGYGKNNEPVRGYVLTFIIATSFILMGGLNTIAPLISNFFLAAYTLINFSTFHASLAKPVGWRPTFRFYNMWLSLFGAVLCLGIMFVISWVTALLTFACLLALYMLVSYRKPDVNWGSTTQAQTYKSALAGVHLLNTVTDHVKNYKPQILVLTGFPGERPILTDFSYLLTKGHSLMLCGQVVHGPMSHRGRESLTNRAYNWFIRRKIKAFYCAVDDASFKDGASALIQTGGLGKLKPNILLMGFKEDWQTCPRSDLVDYVEIMHKALDVHMALAILRVGGGLHCDATLEDDLKLYLQEINSNGDARSTIERNKELKSTESLNAQSIGSSMSDLSTTGSPQLRRAQVSADPSAKVASGDSKQNRKQNVSSVVKRVLGGSSSSGRRSSSFSAMEHFTRRQSGCVDVWWLYDDGGLTLLLPYILSTRRAWSSCPLRVFTLANKNTEIELEERNMASLLSKFRIDYSALKMIPDITKRPKDSTLAYFDKLIAPFRTGEENGDATQITEADLEAAQDRTHRHLRLRELISEVSSNARLVCVTLPMPRRRGVVPPSLYLAWLHAISTAADRVLLVRGNHAAVLTFYS